MLIFGGEKRKYPSKFARRAEAVLTAHEAADVTRKADANGLDNNQNQRVTAKYMHAKRQRIQSEPNDANTSATSTKKGKGQRGKHRSLVVEKKTLGGQCKLEVEIPDYVRQAIGDNARNLVNFYVYVVTTTALMDAKDWGYVASTYGPAMWPQNKFKIKDSEHELPRLQAFVMYAMQRLYRYWKSRLHTYYKECGATHEERLDNPPEDFSIDNWRHCCATFDSDDFKNKSARNSKNRKSDKWCKHSTGNLAFPEVEDILTKKNNKVKPTADVIWLAEHTHIDDGVLVWVDDKRSKQMHSDLHDLVQNKDKEGAPQTQEEMLLQVLGSKSTYTCGKGSGYGGSIKARINEEQQQKNT
ncbi:hypothetical protein Cgig2_028609 [Carnegiea gigantea]|uniref:Transposase n=1 Tax=Carnegiea gigantea TaxID=171969 RepID=A0A9Q1QDN5_9CARY|nr:hypothetical protein Cgig2_028609 [Carnegiea gigantea]